MKLSFEIIVSKILLAVGAVGFVALLAATVAACVLLPKPLPIVIFSVYLMVFLGVAWSLVYYDLKELESRKNG